MTINEIRIVQEQYHQVFDSPMGEKVLESIDSICGVKIPLYFGGDVNVIMLNEGKRQVALSIRNMLELSAEQIYRLLGQQ